MKTIYRVEGMTCGGCVRSVTNALERAGLQATVDLDSHTATVEGTHDPEKVRKAVEGAGFDYDGVVNDGHA
ncbi:MAG: heavy-metal-associated domain-containing protein [Myxococcales bacterium]|nr:heavy-metal-associated domain-containing protein [Myxococcales bacterium]MCB9670157.1 heavy-metal-associated domain-containing protein [Alphaproteobacteria bacterium]MCB9693598.1 heavy-metal-associated domain-containing protein [Alphaproteobacteria bacterium]